MTIADSSPIPIGGGIWSQSIFWPFAGQAGPSYEGVKERHLQGSSIVFVDGHAEFKWAADVNTPFNGSTVNLNWWDPLQREP